MILGLSKDKIIQDAASKTEDFIQKRQKVSDGGDPDSTVRMDRL